MNQLETTTVIWILLPLYGDLNYNVRLLWSRFRKNAPSYFQLRCNSVLPHAEDSVFLANTSWEDVLIDNSTLVVNSKSLADLQSEIDQLAPAPLLELVLIS